MLLGREVRRLTSTVQGNYEVAFRGRLMQL
jgi:hypothetical protein